MEIKLKPCPFRGSNDVAIARAGRQISYEDEDGSEKYTGKTINCKLCDGNCGLYSDFDAAIYAWNTRAYEPI